MVQQPILDKWLLKIRGGEFVSPPPVTMTVYPGLLPFLVSITWNCPLNSAPDIASGVFCLPPP